VSHPWTTIPSVSPTSRQSTPAESSKRAVVKSYAVKTLIFRPCCFQWAKSGNVTGELLLEAALEFELPLVLVLVLVLVLGLVFE
jgi:hypothetical protein